MSREFWPPRPIRIEADEAGLPRRVYWDGRWERVRVGGRWRLEDDWWRLGGEVNREYFKLWTESVGRPPVVLVVYRESSAREPSGSPDTSVGSPDGASDGLSDSASASLGAVGLTERQTASAAVEWWIARLVD